MNVPEDKIICLAHGNGRALRAPDLQKSVADAIRLRLKKL